MIVLPYSLVSPHATPPIAGSFVSQYIVAQVSLIRPRSDCSDIIGACVSALSLGVHSRNYFLSKMEEVNPNFMRKLNRLKIRWIIREMRKRELSVWQIAKQQGITPRWARELYNLYVETGEYPYPKPAGRSPKPISEEDRASVLAMKSKHPLSGATTLEKLLAHEGKHIPHNRIHKILKKDGLAKDEPKKQKRRKWIRYQRKHSRSLYHTDWFECIEKEKHTILYLDDASRFMCGGRSFDNATAENSKLVLESAIALYGRPKQAMSDHGPQFTSLPRDSCPDPELNVFQEYLDEQDIAQILARVKHPQSNGKVEKAGDTIKKLTQHFGSLERALEYYNYERPHWSLNIEACETPFQAYIRKMWYGARRKFIAEHPDMIGRYAPQYLDESNVK